MPERSRSASVPTAGNPQSSPELGRTKSRPKLKSPPPPYNYTYPLRRILTAGASRAGAVVHPIKDTHVKEGFSLETVPPKDTLSVSGKCDLKDKDEEEQFESIKTEISECESTAENKEEVTDSENVTDSKKVTDLEDITAKKDGTELKNITELKDVTELKNVTELRDFTELREITVLKDVTHCKAVTDSKELTDSKEVTVKSSSESEALPAPNPATPIILSSSLSICPSVPSVIISVQSAPASIATKEPEVKEPPTTEEATSTAIVKLTKELTAPNYFCNRRTWITTERMNELRRRAQDAVKQNKTFTIRGCFNSVRNALMARGWVEKMDAHRKHVPNGVCQVTYDDLAQGLPKRKPGETRRAYITKCERNIMSRFLEHMPIDFLWTNRKEKCDYIDQAKNPGMTINKFHRAPFTTKEGLCNQLKEFHWFYEEGTAEMYFPRCFNVWSPEELGDFIENYKLTACIGFIRNLVDSYKAGGFDAVFCPTGKIPFSAIDFALKRCSEFMDSCQHNDIDVEDPPKVWEHDWDAFLYQHYMMANEEAKILADPQRIVEHIIRNGSQLLLQLQDYWPQYSLDGFRNLWIVKPANKCRGRGIQLMDNLKKILAVVNPAITSKSRYVVQKYIERPLIIHQTKFDIRQWFLITNVQPLVVWMYKESYLRFSSQEYSLTNHHESVHLTNHAIQKKYTNGKRDRRLPNENMWDCYSFQAYLRQIGKQDLWHERIYPGMRKAIVGTMLAAQDNMDRRPNTFELFGADFMICENFYPWLIEINSSPDLGATTSVTARMCPQCLEDVVKVVIDRRTDPKTDVGNFDLIYRQIVPPTPAYMGLNLFVKGKQIVTKTNHHHGYFSHHRRERSLHTSQFFRHRTSLVPAVANVHKTIMPTFNATELLEKTMGEALNSSRSSMSGSTSTVNATPASTALNSARHKMTPPCPNLLRTPQPQVGVRQRSFTNLIIRRRSPPGPVGVQAKSEEVGSSTAMKRNRSCGPSISSLETGEKKFKFIIRKCSIQKKLEDSAKDRPPTGPVAYGRSLSCGVVARKACRRMERAEQNWSNVLDSAQRAAQLAGSSSGASQDRPATSSLHAIGRGLTSWKFNRKRNLNSKGASSILMTSKSAGNLLAKTGAGTRQPTTDAGGEATAKRRPQMGHGSRNTKC